MGADAVATSFSADSYGPFIICDVWGSVVIVEVCHFDLFGGVK